MQAGYFSTAWNDIKGSPGWIKKMFFLALINLIPIFGQIATEGYLYGWARDIAWGVKNPMPARVFGNEDGKLYSRGFFILVLGFVLAIVPSLIYTVYIAVAGVSVSLFDGSNILHGGIVTGTGVLGVLFYLLYLAALLLVNFVSMVGSMRISIYGRLSAGFQFKKIWAMMKQDFQGLLRIFGMVLLLSLGLSLIIFVVLFIALFFILFIAAFITAGAGYSSSSLDSSVWGMVLAAGGVTVVIVLVASYVSLVFAVFMEAMMVRALGYWTRQFDVPNWRGQDDPMPFELNPPTPQSYNATQSPYPMGYQAPPMQGQPYDQQPVYGQQSPHGQEPIAQQPPQTNEQPPVNEEIPPPQSPQAPQTPQASQVPQAPEPPGKAPSDTD